MAPLLLVTAMVASYMCYAQGQSSCRTPSGAGGSCISLYDCTQLVTIVSNPNKSQKDIQLLRDSHCGYDGQVPKVCCQAQNAQNSQNSATQDTCYTPDGEQGKCMGIYSCPHLAALLKPPVPKETVAFVQNSRCQGPEQYSVCCGPPPSPTPNPTPRPAPGPQKVCTMTAAPPDPSTRCCGVDSITGDKIVGGTATSVDQYPWLVLIEYFKNNRLKLLCGGALISGRYVLTAGHCVVGPVLDLGTPRNVRLGEYDTSNDGQDCIDTPGGGRDCTDGVTVLPIENVIAHPQYDPRSSLRRHDIALLRLRQTALYTDFIRPICLPTFDISLSPPTDSPFYAAGWGAVNSTVGRSDIKLHVDVPFVSKEQCQPAYTVPRRNVALWQGQLCAGGEEGKDSCKGDSGGPLMYEIDRHYEVVGIVSFGPTPCGMENIPGVYTKVFEYNSWIRSQIKP